MVAPPAAALVLLLAAGAAGPRVAAPARATSAPRASAPAARSNSDLERARAQLAEVKRDPNRRRYRHHWERAITAMEKAARGRDAAPALLEAARARYALYRFSQVDADRAAALALAARARRAGSREAASFSAAVRREMGEEEVAATAHRGAGHRTASAQPAAREARPTGSPRQPERTGTQEPRRGTPGPSAVASTKRGGGAAPNGGAAPRTPGAAAAVASARPVIVAAPLKAPTPARQPDRAPETTTEPAPAPALAGGDEEEAADPALEQAVADGAAPGQDAAEGPARVTDLRSWSNGDYTRIAVYLSRPVPFTREEVPADEAHPRRLALDLAPAQLDHRLAHDVSDAMVQRVRAAQRAPEAVRVVLDLAGRDDLAIFQLQDPPRLIIDVGVREQARAAAPEASPLPAPGAPAERTPGRETAAGPTAGAAAQAPAPPPAPATPSAPSTSSPSVAAGPAPSAPGPAAAVTAPRDVESELAPRRAVRRVVVDAGHGGHDTGAIGPTGVREKDVTLAMAHRLARKLAARGFEVVLTRADDRFVPLEERTAIANARHGDLFVSLHANAHPRRDRRGVETYVLNVADGRYAARLAARENGALGDGGGDGPEVLRILSDLDAKSSVGSSRRLATMVQREVTTGIRTRIGDVRDLGVKSALFYVLLGARMPAVLVETSFVSNRVEERRLGSPKFQDEVAASVARAVERFAAREARVAAR